MDSAPTDIVKEIAGQMDCGLRAFIHKTTGQLIFVPDEIHFDAMDLEAWAEDLEQLEKHSADYHEIERWTSSDSFRTMEEFAAQVTDHRLQDRLFDALRKNKPFRNFMSIIDNSGYVRQEWFDFKLQWQEDYVARQLNLLKQTDE